MAALPPRKKISVLHVLCGLSADGGTGRVARDLATALPACRNSRVWVHREFPSNDPIFIRQGSARRANAGIARDLFNALREVAPLMRAVRHQRVNILHAHSRVGIIAGWLAHQFTGVPLVLHFHFLATRVWLYRLLLHTSCGAAVYNSPKTMTHYGARHGTVIFPSISWPEDELRPSEARRLVATSSLVPAKNIPVLIGAVGELGDRGSPLACCIYGASVTPSAYERELLQLCRRTSGVTVEQWADTWQRSLHSNDIFVHLGHPEAFGISLLEAFAAGLKIVVLPETFLDMLPPPVDGCGVYRAAELSPTAVADAIIQALNDPIEYQQLRSVRSEMREAFSTASASAKTQSVYDTLMPRDLRDTARSYAPH